MEREPMTESSPGTSNEQMPSPPVDPAHLQVGVALPERDITSTMAEMFLYSAVIWNPHRIHYDTPYVTEVEGYPGVVITGPLQGDWLLQAVTEWIGDIGTLERFSFENRRAAYLGETLTTGGSVTEFDPVTGRVVIRLYVRNEKREIITPGEAVVVFPTME